MREIKFRAWVPIIEDMFSWKRLVNQNDWWNHEDYKLMQFTGLQDKRGKDIYEGDFLESPGHSVNEIIFLKGTFGLGNKFIVGITPLIELDLNEWEIIGNIWENA